MPPKKKGKKRKVIEIDGVDTSTLTREKLEAFALALKSELDREREERNFFQLERDKIRTFWEITRNELENLKENNRDKNKEILDIQLSTDFEIQNFKQTAKYLQFKNRTAIANIRAQMIEEKQLLEREQESNELDLLREKTEVLELLREKEDDMQMQLKEIKDAEAQKLSTQLQQFEQDAQEMENKYKGKLENQKHFLEVRHRMEMFEVQERKNKQIRALLEAHEKSFQDMKNYYNDVTLNNLTLISSLKEEMETLRKSSFRNERFAADISRENKKLVEPLREASSKVSELENKLQHYERDQQFLQITKRKLQTLQKNYDDLKLEAEIIKMLNETLQNDRSKEEQKFENLIMEFRQKCGLKNALLQHKVNILEEDVEKREVLLNEIFKGSQKEPGKLRKQVYNVLEDKNKQIECLKYEVARICKAYNDLIATYDAKLEQFNIPKDQLGFEPLRTSSKIRLGAGPAGLVTKNL